MSEPVVVTAAERPGLWARAASLDEDVWPEYNRHGDVLNEYWGRLDEDFADFQFVLYDEKADQLLAQGHTIPFPWDGTAAGLPPGIDGLVIEAFVARERGEAANALSALAIEIPPARQRAGLSSLMLAGMRGIARRQGLGDLVAPYGRRGRSATRSCRSTAMRAGHGRTACLSTRGSACTCGSAPKFSALSRSPCASRDP